MHKILQYKYLNIKKKPHKEKFLIYADFCAPWYTGGSAEYVATFISYLKKNKVPFYLITRKAFGRYSNQRTPPSQKNNVMHIGGIFKLIKNIPKLISEHLNAKKCIIHHPVLGLIGLFFSAILGTHVIYHFHGPFHLESEVARGNKAASDKLRWFMQLILLKFSSVNIVHSSYMKKLLVQQFNIRSQKIVKIKLAVDAKKFHEPFKNTKNFFLNNLKSKNKKHILFLNRRLTPRTGVLEFIEFFKKNRNLFGEKWLLAVAGKGELASKVSAMVSEEVIFLGYLTNEQLVHAYQSANATILPSISLEGFGLIVIESIFCGTPVIVSSKSGGGAEFMRKIAPQLIYKNKSAQSLSNALNHAIKMKNINSNSFRKIKEQAATFKAEKIFENYINY